MSTGLRAIRPASAMAVACVKPGAFSAEVVAGSAQEMRPNREF
jgi:hypothetical protein